EAGLHRAAAAARGVPGRVRRAHGGDRRRTDLVLRRGRLASGGPWRQHVRPRSPRRGRARGGGIPPAPLAHAPPAVARGDPRWRSGHRGAGGGRPDGAGTVKRAVFLAALLAVILCGVVAPGAQAATALYVLAIGYNEAPAVEGRHLDPLRFADDDA